MIHVFLSPFTISYQKTREVAEQVKHAVTCTLWYTRVNDSRELHRETLEEATRMSRVNRFATIPENGRTSDYGFMGGTYRVF